MPSVSLSFKVHIPYRLKKFTGGSVGAYDSWFDDEACSSAVNTLADECYLPANNLLHDLIKKYNGRFKVAFSISGTAIELLQKYRPDVIKSFRNLSKTGCIEFFSETYYHSLSWLHSENEFKRQIKQHDDLIKVLFGEDPLVFRNTELIYCNKLARFINSLGYKGILCEGLDRILKGRTPNQVYAAPANGEFGLLLRNVRLSDDIAFRFDDPTWNEQPLTAEKFAGWIHGHTKEASIVNLFFDYETFGIHKKSNSGIFDFLKHLPGNILENEVWEFVTPSEALEKFYPKDIYDVSEVISWEDQEMASCVLCENMMQNNTLIKIYSLESMVRESRMPGAKEWWGALQSADHFYYMCNDGRTANDTYRMLNPFATGEEAFENYKNALADLEIKLIQKELEEIKSTSALSQIQKIFSTMIY